MANTKISALAALTGANLAVADLLVAVDVSDTTMAASGTDKYMLATEACIGLGRMGLATNRVQDADVSLPANYSMIVSLDYEIASGNVLDLGADASLEII